MFRDRFALLCYVVTFLAGSEGCSDVELGGLGKSQSEPGDAVACDGAAYVGDPCVAGEGTCEREGVLRCNHNELVCDAEARVPAGIEELCATEADEDCDSVIDEAPDDGCCTDADCAEGVCVPRLLPGLDAGQAIPAAGQGGVCQQVGSDN